jgi:hypothetical protein
MAVAPDDLHEWISFEDPHEHRTWMVDVTFLLSPWTCIYGCGCQGVLTQPAAAKAQGCCSYGAHFLDDDDVERVRSHVERLTADDWQFRKQGLKNGWIRTTASGDRVSRLVDDACIFLNRPGYPGGPGCALHRAALREGERPLDWKPDVCWQLPLRKEDSTDDRGHVTTTVREWHRRDWGAGGEQFAWWCTEAPEAFTGATPVYVSLREELVELVGAEVYGIIEGILKERRRRVFVAHPTVRRPTA